MDGVGVVFTGPRVAELEDVNVSSSLAPTEVLIRTEASLISAGTETSYFTGIIQDAPPIYAAVPPFRGAQASEPGRVFPARTGYANVGRVILAGEAVEPDLLGRRVFSMSRHASVVTADTELLVVPVPETVDPLRACFARLAGVGMTALRASDASFGDRVVIIGLGLVGNLAAQLFALAGCEVIALDPDPGRRELARECGIEATFDPTQDNPVERVRAWSGGGAANGADVVVEATGRAQQAVQAIEMTARYGASVLLGSPRVAATAEITDALARVHWLSLRVIGGSEWGFPLHDGSAGNRFTLERNYREILQSIDQRLLITDPLITHVLSPSECQTAYSGITDDPATHVGVVFDWATSDPISGSVG